MGMSGIVIGLAPALGPTLSGWIIDHYTWRYLFGMVIPIVILVLILAVFLMKSVIELSHPKIDIFLPFFQPSVSEHCCMVFPVSETRAGEAWRSLVS